MHGASERRKREGKTRKKRSKRAATWPPDGKRAAHERPVVAGSSDLRITQIRRPRKAEREAGAIGAAGVSAAGTITASCGSTGSKKASAKASIGKLSKLGASSAQEPGSLKESARGVASAEAAGAIAPSAVAGSGRSMRKGWPNHSISSRSRLTMPVAADKRARSKRTMA